jgi:hypothetical protein
MSLNALELWQMRLAGLIPDNGLQYDDPEVQTASKRYAELVFQMEQLDNELRRLAKEYVAALPTQKLAA